MIREALAYLNERFIEAQAPKVVHEDEFYIWRLLKDKNEGNIVKAFEKKAIQRRHRFATLEGFLSYLQSEHTAIDHGPVFVGEKSINLPLRYGKTVPDVISLGLSDSEEWAALMSLQHGVTQKTLWRLLVTKLAGCVDVSLLMTIGTLTMNKKQESGASIDPFGITTSKGAAETVVTFPAAGGAGEQKRSIANEWTFLVRRWECFSQTFQVVTTLELGTDNGEITFTFHPRRMKQVEQTSRASLVAEIQKGVPERFTVHEGEL